MASSFDNAPGKIFIGGISPNTTQDTIQKYFEQYGELCDCVLMQDKATGKSRCFGFVTYKDANAVDDVLSKKHIIDSKEIDCKRAIPRDQHSGDTVKEGGSMRTKKLFVGGLTQTTTEEQFRQYFEQFGTIEDSVIMVDKETGKSRGFGFVTFDSEEAVDRVVEKYNDNKIDGKWVECKRAQAKDIMQNTNKKGMKHGAGGSGRDQSSHQSSHRHSGRSGGSQGQGYYQNSPTSGYSSSKKSSSRSQPIQDSYGAGGYPYQGGYMQGSGRPAGYDGGAPPGYGAGGYDYGQPGYDYYDYNRSRAGWNYPGSEYPANMAGNYPYQAGYNPQYPGGYPAQYSAGYGQQGYDPMAMGTMAGNPSVSSTAATASATKGSDSASQMSANSAYQYPTGTGTGTGYAPEAYGYGTQGGDYGASAAYAGYGGMPQQGKYASQAQAGSPSYGKQGQSDIGPVKGGSSKKQGVESRYFQPY